jgi:hypothetical protein
MPRTSRIAAAVLAAALVAPAAASADSIVFLDGGNVWSASADGAQKVQLTDGGTWHSVTQADDGTIAASRNLGQIEVLARDGRPLRTITTPAAPTGNGGTHRGTPINLAFSPDGRTIAYEYFDVTCPPASSCPSEQHSVLYTSADGPTATPREVHGQQFGRRDPSWVTNGRTLVFGGAGSQVGFDDLGGGDTSTTLWFNGNADFSDGELSRDGRRLALSVGSGDETRIGFFRVNGDPATSVPPAPTPADTVCGSTPDAKNGGASWSPDGTALAYASSKGVEIVRFRSFEPGACDVAGESILAPTGSEPDWGPADPPAARFRPTLGAPAPAPAPGPVPPAPAPRPAGPATPAPGGGAAGGAGAGGLAIARTRVTTAALRRGLTVTVTAPAPGRVTVRATSGGRRLATGRATARTASTVRVKLGKVSRRAAARLRGRRVTLVATVGDRRVTRTVSVR